MSRSQITTTIVAIIGVIALSFLPKIVVKNNQKELVSDQNSSAENVVSSAEEQHMSQLPEEQFAKRDSLLGLIATNTAVADKAEQLVSLIELYRRFAIFDSAAIFADQLVGISPTLAHTAQAGDVYYEAFSLALRPEKMKTLGEKARFYFQKVLDEDPKRLDVKTKMGMTYISTDNPMAGIMMLREVLAENPNYVPAITNMGVLSLQSQQYERALERFDQLLVIDSTNLQAHFYRAISLAELGRQEEAKTAFLYLKERERSPELLKTIDEYLSQLK